MPATTYQRPTTTELNAIKAALLHAAPGITGTCSIIKIIAPTEPVENIKAHRQHLIICHAYAPGGLPYQLFVDVWFTHLEIRISQGLFELTFQKPNDVLKLLNYPANQTISASNQEPLAANVRQFITANSSTLLLGSSPGNSKK